MLLSPRYGYSYLFRFWCYQLWIPKEILNCLLSKICSFWLFNVNFLISWVSLWKGLWMKTDVVMHLWMCLFLCFLIILKVEERGEIEYSCGFKPWDVMVLLVEFSFFMDLCIDFLTFNWTWYMVLNHHVVVWHICFLNCVTDCSCVYLIRLCHVWAWFFLCGNSFLLFGWPWDLNPRTLVSSDTLLNCVTVSSKFFRESTTFDCVII